MNAYALKPWVRPSNYAGATWEGWLVFLGRNRDSDLLTNHNFDTALATLLNRMSISAADALGQETVRTVRESHWACGWVEWIAIHPSDTGVVQLATDLADNLDTYPILDEYSYSDKEHNAANENWDWGSVREMLRENGISKRVLSNLPALGTTEAHAVLELMNERGRIELLPEGPSWGEYGSGRDDMAAVLRLIRKLARE